MFSRFFRKESVKNRNSDTFVPNSFYFKIKDLSFYFKTLSADRRLHLEEKLSKF